MNSPRFPYVIGAYQARLLNGVPRNLLQFSTKHKELASKLQVLLEEETNRCVDLCQVEYKDQGRTRTGYRISASNKGLLEMIRDATINGSRAPTKLLSGPLQYVFYLRGVFDSCAVPSYEIETLASTRKRKYPRVIITKKKPLWLKDLKALLEELKIFPQKTSEKRLRIRKLKSIARILSLGLFTLEEKDEKLRNLYSAFLPIS